MFDLHVILIFSKRGDSVDEHKETIEIKEFDSLICKKEYEDNRKRYISEEQFNSIIAIIEELSTVEDGANVLDFLSITWRKNIGKVITLKNFVGLIQLPKRCSIQVLPKIDLACGDCEDNRKTKEIFISMIRSMKDFQGKAFNKAFLAADRMNLYEVFISMYLQGVRSVVQKGLKSSYLLKEDNLRFYKGKLLVNNHIKNNFTHKERFYVVFDEFQINRPENRLIKATLLELRMRTTSLLNSREIRQLLAAFEGVEPSVNYENDFAKTIIDRNTKDYVELLQWSKIFLMKKSFTMFSGIVNARAILFPMEKVFESYVAREISKVFTVKDGWCVLTQNEEKYLFTEPKKKFGLRPDIVLKNSSKVVIMDTKWKRLNIKEHNYGISTEDMYQMYVYSKSYETRFIWLLYPQVKDLKNTKIYYKTFDDTEIRAFFVNLEHIKTSIAELKRIVESHIQSPV